MTCNGNSGPPHPAWRNWLPTVHRSTCAISDPAMTMTMCPPPPQMCCAGRCSNETARRSSLALKPGNTWPPPGDPVRLGSGQHLHSSIRRPRFLEHVDADPVPLPRGGHPCAAARRQGRGHLPRIPAGHHRGRQLRCRFQPGLGRPKRLRYWESEESSTTSAGDSSRPETRPVVVDRHSPKLSVAGRNPHRALNERGQALPLRDQGLPLHPDRRPFDHRPDDRGPGVVCAA